MLGSKSGTEVVFSYIALRRLIGPSLGFVMPLVLSAYELAGTSLVSRVFVKEFVSGLLFFCQLFFVDVDWVNFWWVPEVQKFTIVLTFVGTGWIYGLQ